jgi:indolepyruvate ferredoxin oxidoreductase
LERAIELNGAAVPMNKTALAWGRVAAERPEVALEALESDPNEGEPTGRGTASVEELVARRKIFLASYQNRDYAQSYAAFVRRIADAEQDVSDRTDLSRAVARNLFALMAYKDEYEVARLYTDGSFSAQISEMFEGDFQVKLNLAPQRFFPTDRRTGRVRKVTFGPWIFPALRVLARLRFLRGTPLDLFGRTPHRREERRLITEYQETMGAAMPALSRESYDTILELARWPELVKGFGVIKDEGMVRARQERDRLVARLASQTSASEVML